MILELFAETDAREWDYYISKNKIIFSVSKDGDKKRNSYFGNIRHILYVLLNDKQLRTINLNIKYREDIEKIMRDYANKKETDRYNKIVNYKKMTKTYKY